MQTRDAIIPGMTGWANTDARQHMPCPKCNAQPGDHCRTPKGRKAAGPHVERLRVLHAQYGYAAWRYTPAVPHVG